MEDLGNWTKELILFKGGESLSKSINGISLEELSAMMNVVSQWGENLSHQPHGHDELIKSRRTKYGEVKEKRACSEGSPGPGIACNRGTCP